ncbi:hypothetical protein BGZ97_001121 [Linnemannia gamsii]|uniref:F-box domain-containing protein n=1 Tax=Linnemannia gamsii TaxID=64522 RepID=A0A9P6QXA2_9FUNG|nr:hypothetical protein BGZ97_001121 [Linnemannia gamsii]
MLKYYKLHPLLLPEILSRVSLSIPAWECITNTDYNDDDDDDRFSNSKSPHYRFSPSNLISCSKVCRTWYSIFYPALWTIYDGYAMSPVLRTISSSSVSYSYDKSSTTPTTTQAVSAIKGTLGTYWVPDAIILAQSTHIQILLNDHRHLFGRLHYELPKLVDLTIYGDNPGFVHLIRSHGPQLKRLKWVGNVPFSGMLSDLELDCLATLTAVEELWLGQWDVSAKEVVYDDEADGNDGGEDGEEEEEEEEDGKRKKRRGLIEVLVQTCSETLRRLTLQNIQGLDDLPPGPDHSSPDNTSCSDSDSDSSSNTRTSNDSNNNSEGGGGGDVILERLEELVVDGEWVENKALFHFLIGQASTSHTTLKNFCPRLKRLDLGAGLLEDPEMIARLEGMLPLSHPGLVRDTSIIGSRPWARYQQIRPRLA